MYLQAIEIQGFKSFPDRVKLQFGRGMTAVVGPNGSGKSNLSDAVRWVLGEQSTKTLRGAKMEDVIFSGTKQRKPTGFALVSLHINNADRVLPVENDLCTITRKLYRSGESDYLINGEAVRLRDVRELFMDTGLGRDGYSVIGQGRIAEIVAAKDSERREIFEEAAGISKFRYRKEEALRRLAGAQDNLNRLQDIAGELESRIGPLKEQAQKAETFLKLSQEKKSLEISLWLTRFSSFSAKLREMENQVLLRRQEYETAQAGIDAIDKQLEEQGQRIAACSVGIQEKNNRRSDLEKEMGELSSRAAVCKANVIRNEEDLARLEQVLEEQGQAAHTLQEEEETLLALLKEQQGREQQAQGQAQSAAGALRLLEQQGEALAEEFARGEEAHRQAVRRLSDEKLGAATAQSSLQELGLRLQALKQEQQMTGEVILDTQRGLEAAQDLIQAAGEKAQEQANICAGYQRKLETRRGKLEDLRKKLEEALFAIREQEQKAAILKEMEESLEGFSPSVKTVMKFARAGVIPGVIGPVSGLIRVKAEYATAIETALGMNIQNIVVEEEHSAREAIRVLKERNGGRATFLPLSTIKPRFIRERDLEENDGYVGIASSLVEIGEQYRPVAEFLLGNILIAEDLGSASRMARRYQHRYRIVTLDGQVINPGGSFTGGSQFKSGGFITRSNQMGTLEKQAEQLKAAYQAKLPEFEAAKAEITALEKELRSAMDQRDLILKDQTEARVQAGGLSSSLSEQQSRLAALEKEEKELAQRQISLREITGRSDSRREEAEQDVAAAEETLRELTQRRQMHQERQAQAGKILQELQMVVLGLQKDRENSEERLSSLRGRITDAGQDRQRQEQRKEQLKENTLRLEEEIRQTQAVYKTLRSEQAALEQEAEALAKERLEREAEATRLRQEERVQAGLKEQVSRSLAALEEKMAAAQGEYDGLTAKLWDEYELTRSEAARMAEPLPDTIENQHKLLRLRQEIRALGTVNVEAVEEYRQVSGRYTFLKGQMEDAARAKEELEKLIEGLTRSMVTLFSQSFDRIGTYFTQIFKELFGGGSASLRLTDENNVLESGIEILVEPPGKIIKNLSLLSGGEQALVAIALYFAILKYRPSPFCVLDEIEAALDDVNVNKYASYVKRAGEKTQFIVITHRRGTMEAADVLYGVTMQEEGVSKLLQIDVAQAERELLQKQA